MPIDPFCSRVNNYVCSPFQWFEKITTTTESIVNDQGQVIYFSEVRELCKVRNIQSGITDCFQVDRLCIFIDMFYKAFRVIPVCKTGVDAQAFESYFELIVGPTVEISGGDEIVSCLQDIVQCKELGRLTGTGGLERGEGTVEKICESRPNRQRFAKQTLAGDRG